MPIEGVLLVDKPKGPSSFNVVHKIRRLTGVKRVGHAGTLDPLASGLLAICLGRYTKLASLLTDGHKIYESVFCLGVTTSTDDGEGEIVETKDTSHMTHAVIDKALQSFVGKIQQIPPQFSAVKIGGQRAYAMARKGEELELRPREIEIFSIEVVNCSLPEITLRIHCSKGTYVRSLARDLGKALKTGAYAKEIRRVASGSFAVDGALSVDILTKEVICDRLLTKRQAILGLPTINIDEETKDHLIHGRKIDKNYKMVSAYALAIYEDDLIAILNKAAKGIEIARVF